MRWTYNRIGLIFWFFGVFIGSMLAQFKFDQSTIFNVEDGLPVKNVRNIQKGPNGFVWFTTTNGLGRFDGSQFKSYQYDPEDTTSIYSNSTNWLAVTNNRVWVTTDLGISALNLATNTFKNYQLNAEGKTDSLLRVSGFSTVSVYEDSSGDIWVGTQQKGIFKYLPEEDDFKPFPWKGGNMYDFFPSFNKAQAILCITESHSNDSIIWAGTNLGLFEVNKHSGKISWFATEAGNKEENLELNSIRRIYHHDNGMVYCGTWGRMLRIFDPVKKTIQFLPVKDQLGKEDNIHGIRRISRKSKHEIWITHTEGLSLYNTQKNEITFQKKNIPREFKFYGADYIDEFNRFWVGTAFGLHLFDPMLQQFTFHSFMDLNKRDWGYSFYVIQQPSKDFITVFPRAADGLFHFDKAKKTWRKTPFPKHDPTLTVAETGARGMAVSPNGDFTLSSSYGLFSWSPKTDKITRLSFQPELEFNRFYEIFWDSFGRLWVSTNIDGLYRWDPKTDEVRNFKKELEVSDSLFGVSSLGNFLEDSKKNIWFDRNGGIGVYLAEKDTVLNFLNHIQSENSFPFVHSIVEDKNGKVWFSSSHNNLGWADVQEPEKGIVRKFNVEKYISPDRIQQISVDPEGNIWAQARTQLLKFKDNDTTFTSFSYQYGASGKETFSFDILPSGEITMGGRQGIIIAKPEELQHNSEVPKPYLTNITVVGKPIVGRGLLINKEPVNLGPKENFFTIHFSAKAFTMPQQVKFKYRLIGFQDWIETTENRVANFTNVPGGNYTFQLKAANNEGVWNDELLELPIFVATPWWNQVWVQVLAFLLLTATGFGFYKYRVYQVRKEEKLKTDFEKKLADVEMSALRAQMNPHFLFNCLNSIESFVIKNETKKASEYLNNFARLIRLILQNSRTNMVNLKSEMEAIELYLEMESLRFRDKFYYEIQISDEVDLASIDIPPMLMQPYIENAIWHGLMHKADRSNGKVNVLLNRDDNYLYCIIEDNGIGREKAMELKAKRPQRGKKSVGMRITKDRINVINKLYNSNTSVKIIDLKNEKDEALGTRVELVIPI